MGVLKDLHDILISYLPKRISLNVFMYKDSNKYQISITNTTGKKIRIKDIQINNKDINTISPVIGLEIDPEFPLHKDQERILTIHSSRDVEIPKTIQFYIKRKLCWNKKLEFYI